jgi:HD-like signal output (HDOD) protein
MPATKIPTSAVLQLLHERKALPVFPAIISRLDEALAEQTVNMDRVVAIIAADIMIASRVLKAAGSVRYGMNPPKDLVEAVARLGFTEVRAIAFAVSYTAGFTKPAHIAIHVFGRHAFAAAVAARVLSVWFAQERKQRVCDMATAFLLGLAHDSGVLLLDLLNPEAYGQVIEAVAQGEDSLQAEQRIMGTTHPLISAALMKYWRFSDHMAMAVAAHHYPTRLQPESQALADLVLFAEVIAVRLGYGNGVYQAPSPAMQGVIQQRCEVQSITEEDIMMLSEQVDQQLQAEGWLALADGLG